LRIQTIDRCFDSVKAIVRAVGRTISTPLKHPSLGNTSLYYR
jgi:hypothetical protein